MDNQLIDLDPKQANQPLINLDPVPQISEGTAASRSAKVDFGLSGVLQKDYPDIHQSISNGEEKNLRTDAANTLTMQQAQYRQSQITNLAANGQLDDKTFANLQMPPVNPDSVFEEGFAHTWMSSLETASLNMGDSFLKDVPLEHTQGMTQLGSSTVAKHEIMRTAIQNIQDQIEDQSTAGYVADYAKSLVPFYDEIKLRGRTPGVGEFAGGFLGSDLNRQAAQLALEPLEQFKVDFPKAVDDIAKDNPQLALRFAQTVLGNGSSDEFMQNVFSAANIASIPGVGALARKGLEKAGLSAATTQAVKDMTAAVPWKSEAFRHDPSLPQLDAGKPIPPERALAITSNLPSTFPLTGIMDKSFEPKIPLRATAMEAAGDTKSAAVERLLPEISADLQGKANPTVRAIEPLTSVYRLDMDALAANPGSLSREQLLRLQNQFMNGQNSFLDTVKNTMRTMRVPLDKASRAVVLTIAQDIKNKYPGISNRVLDVTNPYYEGVSNTWHLGLNIGDINGQLFTSEKSATISANMQDLKGFEVRQQGLGYYIRMYKPIDETSDAMRTYLKPLAASPKNFLNETLLGKFRTPEDTMSRLEMQSRKTALYPMANFFKYADEENQFIKDLQLGNIKYDPVSGVQLSFAGMKARSWRNTFKTYQAWKEWKSVLSASRDLWDLNSKTPGYTFKTPGEYEDFFFSHTGRLPSFPETEAYFAKTRLDTFDWLQRNMRMYTNKATRGVETWRIFAGDANGKPTYSGYFDGASTGQMPGGNFSIMISNSIHGEERIFDSASDMSAKLGSKAYNEYVESVAKGEYKVIRLWAPEHRPLSGFGKVGDDRIRYVITKSAENHPLTWNQVPRRGGGHFDYDYEHYIKQANVRKSGGEYWYEGDNTIMPVAIRKMGQDVASHIDNVRLLLKAGKEVEARAYVRDNLPMPWTEIKGWFNLQEGKTGFLSLDEPIQVVPKDRLIGDMSNELADRVAARDGGTGRYRNGVKEGSENAQFQVGYTGERDNRGMFTVEDRGTRNNPLYQYVPAQQVDPMVASRRALNRITNSTFMDDYKNSAMERWVSEAINHLKDTPEEIRAAPFWYFHNAATGFKPGVDPGVKEHLMGNWQKIMQFMGQPSTFDVQMHSLEQKLADSMYDKLGPKGAIVPSWLIAHTKDPIQFTRAMVYHFKLGLFNPAQWILQQQTWTNIYAISPNHAPAGSAATLLHWWSEYNRHPEIMNKMDEYASRMGWKPGEWKEANQVGMKTGFFTVDEGQLAIKDSPMMHQFAGTSGSKFLSLGQVFFKGGVKNVRLGAWYTAFKEFREANPTGALTQSNIAQILDKADHYHANMSRASSANLNRGAFSLAFQFQTYPMRLAEMFLSGSRDTLGATSTERAMARFRMAAVYTALYGIPGSIGLTGFPFGDDFRREAQKNGYIVGDKWLTTMVNEGIPSMMTGLVFGENYNFGEHFGAHGYDAMKGLLRGDVDVWNLMGGAAAQTTLGMIDPVIDMLAHPSDLTISDWLDPLKEISSVNQGWKFYMAAKFGDWYSKKEGLIKSDVSVANAAFMAGFGVQPQQESDIFTKNLTMKERRSFEKHATQQYLKHVERAVRAYKDKNSELAQAEYRKASVYFNSISETRQPHVQALAGKHTSTIVDDVDWQYYINTVPAGERRYWLKVFQDLKTMNRERKGLQ
jgi:hypothetical protein